jgi:hypothetical protein
VIDWYTGTLVSRLNDKEKDSIVVVMQRLHENDLAGYLLGQGGWQWPICNTIRLFSCQS